MVKRFQNKISGSRFLLASVAVITVIVWFAAGKLELNTLFNLCVTAITAYFLVELDTRNSIIRSYSRMIPSSFLLLSTMSGVFTDNTFVLNSLLWTLFLNFLFASYQDRNATGKVFYAFLFLGLASILFIQTLFFVPVIWLVMLNNLMSLGRRTLVASLIGLILPYWFIGGYGLFNGDLSFFATHFTQLTSFSQPLALDTLNIDCIVTLSVLTLFSAIGIVHYMRNSNKDKIRTRMFCEMIITTDIFVLLFILLQPALFVQLLSIYVITTSILISHYIVLTNTKLTNRSVYLIIAIVAASTVYNLWIS